MTIGERIRRARKAKGYTQEYVAEKLNVSRQAVFKWEKDQSKPDTANLIGLAQLLDTTADYLINGKKPNHFGKNSAANYFRAALLSLALVPVCWLTGIFSGAYTDMVQLPISRGLRVGLPFLMYGQSPLAIILVSVSVICLLLFLMFLFLGNQANKD